MPLVVLRTTRKTQMGKSDDQPPVCNLLKADFVHIKLILQGKSFQIISSSACNAEYVAKYFV